MRDFDDFLDDLNDAHFAHYHEDLQVDEDKYEWLQLIYNEYADENGDVDWKDHSHDSAWYYYLTEVLEIDEETVDKYSED